MNLTVLKWFASSVLTLIAKVLEVGFRILLFLLPLGAYLLLIQNRSKVSSVSNLSVYTDDNSVWQHIFPGFILVAKDKNQFKNYVENTKGAFQKWVESNKYALSFIFAASIVVIMLLTK